jgi:hypothetical protein
MLAGQDAGESLFALGLFLRVYLQSGVEPGTSVR